MLAGVRNQQLRIHVDERGYFAEALRENWMEFLENQWVTQANISYSYPNIIRAWHKHVKGQIDYFLVLNGAMKICAFDEETGKMAEIIASEKNPSIVRIPGKYLHGTKTISHFPSLTLYFVTQLYDYIHPDEIRRPWNDPSIIPTEINGTTDDPRVGKPWDWNQPPHK